MAKKISLDPNRAAPNQEQVHYLILKIIEQAVKDYEFYKDKTKEEDIFIYETARDFIFDDAYLVQWGDEELSPAQLCDIVEIEIAYLRKQVASRLDPKLQSDGTFVPDKRY